MENQIKSDQNRAQGPTRGASTSKLENPKGTSYKNVLQGKNVATTTTAPVESTPNPYIVEQQKIVLELNIDTPEIDEHRSTFESKAIICRFNYFWPKPMELFY